MLYKPRAYQELMIDFMLKNLRCNVLASMGTGKTSSSLYAFDAMRLFGEAKRGLIVAPKRVARSTWPKEIDKWEDFQHLKIVPCIGTEAQRLNALRSKCDLMTINYENLEWLVEVMGEAWDFDTVFADEASRLKGLRVSLETSKKGKQYLSGQGSVRAKAIARVAHTKVRRWINLTGSPAPNGLQDLWGIQWFIDAGKRLGMTYGGFEDRFFQKLPGAEGYSRTVPLASSDKLIQDLIRDCCITVDAKDWFDIKAPIERNVMIELPPKARRVYDDMERELFAELESANIEAFSASTRTQKCLQIANGAVYTDSDTKAWEEVHDAKIDALRSVIEEANGESILVRYTHIPDRTRILKAFPKAKFLDDDPRTEDRWNAGEIPILVTHAASAGHGLNLQHGGRILCDFSQDYNLEQDEQIIERVGPTRQAQSGYDRAVYRYRLVAEDTLEELSVLPVLKRKMDVQESLKSAMKIRKTA